MALSSDYRDYICDLFAGLGPVQVRRMFGGAGVYLEDACFALIIDDVIFMRSDEALGALYAEAGSEQWVYEHKKRGVVTMPYWRLPDAAQDDPDEAVAWARRSLGPAQKAAAEKAAAKARRAARKAS